MGFPWNFVSAQGSQKTRMMGLSDGQKRFPIGLAVLIQYRSVTDTQPASQPRCRSYYAQRSGVEPKNSILVVSQIFFVTKL